jgi:hypothetical protein
MDFLIKEITELTSEWYSLISEEHHKDRDCHWYINIKWSYGDKPRYVVEHYGYVYDEVYELFNTYEEALQRLKEELLKAINEEKQNNEKFE